MYDFSATTVEPNEISQAGGTLSMIAVSALRYEHAAETTDGRAKQIPGFCGVRTAMHSILNVVMAAKMFAIRSEL